MVKRLNFQNMGHLLNYQYTIIPGGLDGACLVGTFEYIHETWIFRKF